jgi:hypothetical protein
MNEATFSRRPRPWVCDDWRDDAKNSGCGDRPRDQERGYLYFAWAGLFMKIGWSKRPRQRMRELRSPEGRQPVLLGALHGNRQEETALLVMLQDSRTYGEWTRLTEPLLVAVLDLLDREGVEVP